MLPLLGRFLLEQRQAVPSSFSGKGRHPFISRKVLVLALGCPTEDSPSNSKGRPWDTNTNMVSLHC
jgi:hypothetical protein